MPAGLSFYHKSTGCGWCSFLLLDVPGVNVLSSQDTKKCVKTFKKK